MTRLRFDYDQPIAADEAMPARRPIPANLPPDTRLTNAGNREASSGTRCDGHVGDVVADRRRSVTGGKMDPTCSHARFR